MLFKLKNPNVDYELDKHRNFDFLTVFTTNVHANGLTDHIQDGDYFASCTDAGDHFNITRRRADNIDATETDLSVDDRICLLFAPTWDLVGGYIRGQLGQRGAKLPDWVRKYPTLTEDSYTLHYKNLIRSRLKENGGAGLYYVRGWLRGNAVITLSCECKPNEFCHRRIVADEMLRGLAIQIGLPYNYAGEIAQVYGENTNQLELF